MPAPIGSRPGHSLQLREALTALGGEASVQQLWRVTRIDAARIDKLLMSASWAERASVVRRGVGADEGLGERRWRLQAKEASKVLPEPTPPNTPTT